MQESLKIKITHLVATGNALFATDEDGHVWKRPLDSQEWTQDGELPNIPALVDNRHDQLHIAAPDGLDEEKPKK